MRGGRSPYGVRRANRFRELSYSNLWLAWYVERAFQIKVVAVDIRSDTYAEFHLADNTRVILERERSVTPSRLNGWRASFSPWKAQRRFQGDPLGDEKIFEI